MEFLFGVRRLDDTHFQVAVCKFAVEARLERFYGQVGCVADIEVVGKRFFEELFGFSGALA